MTIPPTGSVDALRLPATGAAASPRRTTEIESVVVRLFEEFRAPLLRYALSFGLSVQDGEEITQEVFLALFRHLQLGKCQRNLRGWIFRVAHNLALKRRQTKQRLEDRTPSGSSAADGQRDASPNPEEQVLSAQRQRRLLAVLDALPEQDRACLRLRAEGLRYREIARVLGVSLGTVSVSLTRSLARLMCADER
jgi:RNA polymerase sigma-70 factor (ECF subfamily)